MNNLKLKQNLKTELRIITITSDGKLFIDEKNALNHEREILNHKEKETDCMKNKERIANILLNILKEHHWGLYFKNEPMQVLPVQDSETTLFKVNEVKSEELFNAIVKGLDERVSLWEDKENQTGSELSNGTETT